jgi:hypothetical protein
VTRLYSVGKVKPSGSDDEEEEEDLDDDDAQVYFFKKKIALEYSVYLLH